MYKCALDPEGQRAKCNEMIYSFRFYISILVHACIGTKVCACIITLFEQNGTVTFYHVGQMQVKRAQIYLFYYISQHIGL